MKRILLVILTILNINAFAQMSNLIISEYAEGSGGNKKYIELFNGTGTTVDLSNYQILRATNGGGYTVTISLSGTLANNTTYSIANNAIDVPGADLYNTQINHNGDDAYALTWNGGSGSVFTNIDVFGDPLNDPGTGWAVAGVANATVDKILTRKSNVCGPNTNWLAIQGVDPLTSEYFISVGLYNQVSQNTGMGNHVHNCVAPCNTYNTLTATACNSYTLNNQTYTTSGTYLQTLTNANAAGCDSIITLNLTINNANSSTLNITNCGPYTYNNQTYSASGTYTQFAQNVAGCDSTITLNLTIQTPIAYYQDMDNDGYGNAAVTQLSCSPISGHVTNNTDCDDNNNAINPVAADIPANGIDEDCNGTDALPCISYNYLTQTACGSYTLNSQVYTSSGTYVQTLPNANFAGCDSIINLVLTINNASASILNFTDCSPFVLNNQTYNLSGTYTQVLQNAVGCDSTITINLTIINPSTVYQDLDNDGFGNAAVSQTVCSVITGYVTNSADCDDNNNMINPGALDIPGNGIDEDCNGADAPLTPVMLGIYQFAGTLDCTTQDNVASNSNLDLTFANFSGVGTNCASGVGIFNRSAWNIGASVDLNQYNEFSVSAANCKSMNLDRVAFKFRPSGSAGSPVWHLRSSLDNFASDLDYGTGVNVNNANLDDTVYLTNHSNLTQVTFRFYITEILGSTTTWRMDDVSLYGNVISLTPQTFYADVDQDGFGALANDTLVCTMPAGYVSNNLDCNDADATINPNTIWYMDMDGDLLGNTAMTFTGCTPPVGYVLNATDCNDSDANITGPTTYYTDVDLDGFGDDASAADFCTPQVNMVTVGGDCNDANNTIYPGITYYADLDQDGYGDFLNDSISCAMPIGFVSNSQDCNDVDSTINPTTVWYIDMDGDLQGDDMNTFTGCTPPGGYVLNANDCDDSNVNISAPTMYFVDVDNDGFGDDATGTLACTQPVNTVIIGGDCNDNDTTIYPGAAEICDGFDNNCNGTNDEGLVFNTYYLDSDNDQFGAGTGIVTCQVNPLPGYVLVNGDCDDMNPNVYPGATDILANDIDENCDGVDGYLGLTDVTSVQVGLVPNPSNGAFAIQFNSEVANANIQVTDMNGKVLFQQWMNGTSLEVSNLRLSTGAYLVHVTLDNQKEILRLIIQ